MTYFKEIDAARDEALTRFKDTKRWRTSETTVADAPIASEAPAVAEAEPNLEIEPVTDADTASDVDRDIQPEPAVTKPSPGTPKHHPRNMTIAQIIAECAAGEKDMLAEMIILQRRVIYDQAQRLGEPATYPTLPAAA
jgi:hypothetical protein